MDIMAMADELMRKKWGEIKGTEGTGMSWDGM
jgi:hypothetical protein